MAASVRVVSPIAAGSGTSLDVGQVAGVGVVLTNHHVVEGATSFHVTFTSGATYPAKILATSTKCDLAMLIFEAQPGTPTARIAAKHPVKGMAIWQVGYGGGRLNQRTGTVVGYRAETAPGAPRNFLLSFAPIPGDSGSGVFLVTERALCGVVWGRINWDELDRRMPKDNCAVELKDVRAFVEESCLPRLRRRPPATSPTPPAPFYPPPPGPTPPAPTIPPAVPPIDRADLDAIYRDLLGKLDEVRRKVETLPDRVKGLETGAGSLGGMLDRLGKELEGAKGDTGDKLKKIGERLQDLKAKIAPVVGKVADVAGKVAGVEATVGGLSWLPWLVGAGTGGTGLLGVAALWLVRRVGKRLKETRGGNVPQSPVSPIAPQPAPPPTTIINQPPPDPLKETILRRESTLVPIEVESLEGEALRWALDELAKRYPGKISDVETVKEFARQYVSGRRKT